MTYVVAPGRLLYADGVLLSAGAPVAARLVDAALLADGSVVAVVEPAPVVLEPEPVAAPTPAPVEDKPVTGRGRRVAVGPVSRGEG